MSALARQGAAKRATGYGALRATAELDSGRDWLALPKGFKYRIVSRQGEAMADGNPTPGIFDGMAAFDGGSGNTILIRNHENRTNAGEVEVVVPGPLRYDSDPLTRGGNTKVVVSPDREAIESFAVLGGTHTNCAGGRTPWDSWITCEEIHTYASGSDTPPGTRHGYIFEVPADATGPVTPVPVTAAGRFKHEAVAWLHDTLYLTEDQHDASFYRFLPSAQPAQPGDLAANGGTLQALVVKGRPNFDMNAARIDKEYAVKWVHLDDPDPDSDTVRMQAQAKGAAVFDRTEGAWPSGSRVYFDCTSGGRKNLGQLWELTPDGDGGTLRLVYESKGKGDLNKPDNLVVVPKTNHVFVQENGGAKNDRFVRGITRSGRIYDFARSIRGETEFCGGCFSADGKTFFLNQQGGRQTGGAGGSDPLYPPDVTAAVTYAIWGPFDEVR